MTNFFQNPLISPILASVNLMLLRESLASWSKAGSKLYGTSSALTLYFSLLSGVLNCQAWPTIADAILSLFKVDLISWSCPKFGTK